MTRLSRLHNRVTKRNRNTEITLGKLLGFLGLSAEITGFPLQQEAMIVGTIVAVIFQVIANSPHHADLYKEESTSRTSTRK